LRNSATKLRRILRAPAADGGRHRGAVHRRWQQAGAGQVSERVGDLVTEHFYVLAPAGQTVHAAAEALDAALGAVRGGS
jgi:hypothetical protein